MRSPEGTLDPWIQVSTAASVSWPVSLIIVPILVGLVFHALSFFWILVTVAGFSGCLTALVTWMPARSRVTSFWKWVVMNIVGIAVAISVGYAVLLIAPSRLGLLLGGIGAGIIAGAIRSLSLQSSDNRLEPVLHGSIAWVLAIAIGSQLADLRSGAPLAVVQSNLLHVLLFGWGLSGVLWVLILIAFSPLPRAGYPRGQIRWWY